MGFGRFGEQSGRTAPEPMAEINTTPLVDVMLVLLIIFIVTAPLLDHAIRIELPKASSAVNVEEPSTVILSVDAAGKVFWNDQLMPQTDLPAAMARAAASNPQPELQVRADLNTRYQRLAEIMSLARNAGITKLGFVTDPGAVGGDVVSPQQ
ncbi:MAG: biopolymer transporter ExbD [Betaproteobacteria bacterium]